MDVRMDRTEEKKEPTGMGEGGIRTGEEEGERERERGRERDPISFIKFGFKNHNETPRHVDKNHNASIPPSFTVAMY